MKINIRVLIAIMTCCFATRPAFCQSNPNGLSISAKASLLTGTNEPKLFLTVYLVNTTNREITVLTKNLNWNLNGATNENGKPILNCTVGYSGAIKHEGILIVPSLCDFSPVTLKANEKAIVTHVLEQKSHLKPIAEDSEITVTYEISQDWATRFDLWNGSATAKPFNASVRKPR